MSIVHATLKCSKMIKSMQFIKYKVQKQMQ